MNVRVFLSGVLASLLLFGPPVNAQSQEGSTVGLGVSINAPSVTTNQNGSRAFSLAPFTFTIPITRSSLRLEPELGFSRSNRSIDDRSVTSSVLTVGTGVFYLSRFDDTLLQIGGRVGLSRLSDTEELRNDEETNSRTNFSIGPAVGGEYYLSDHFSLGLEARFVYVDIGTPDGAPDDFSASRLRTTGLGFFRVHF